jgi:PKD repeat protein
MKMNMIDKKILKLSMTTLLLFVAFTIVLPVSLQATERFVSINGVDSTGNGSIGNPYRKISFAVSAAGLGDTITVMPGTYADGATYLYNQVYLRSQFGPDSTVITGGDSTGVFYLDDYSDAVVIDGFTILEGNTFGIRVFYISPIIKNNRFVNCFADSSSGGAINLYSSMAEIHDNYFFNNHALYEGGAIYAYNSAAQIYNNVFDSNSVINVTGRGGAISIQWELFGGYRTLIQNNVFRNNTGYNGAGLYIVSGELDIYNNLFHDNIASNGGAMYVDAEQDPSIYNNIFMNNSPDGMYTAATFLSNYDNNNYYGNSPLNDCLGCPSAPNIFYMNPNFVDFAGYDYHLADGSGLINRGRSVLSNLLPIDFDNQKRNLAGVVDVGPDEFADCNLSGDFAALTNTEGCPGLIIQFSAFAFEGYYDSLLWDFGDGFFDFNTVMPIHNFSDTGIFTVKLSMITPCTTMTVTKVDYIQTMTKPIPDFSANATIGCAPFSVTFENLTANPVDSHAWDFGDGGTSTDENPTHIFETPGIDTVKYTAINTCGQDSIIKEAYIEVLSGAVSEFTAEPLEGSAPLWVNFTDLSENNPISWQWQFDNGGVTEQDPIHRFLKPGQYDILLISTNDCGSPDSILKADYITIYGFEASLYDTFSMNKYTHRYDFLMDSLYGLYDAEITLKANLTNNPSRGKVSLSIADSNLNLFDSTSLTAALTKDVPRGDYDVLLIGSGPGGIPVDTLILQFTSESDPLILVSTDTIDFGQVPEDSLKNMTFNIENSTIFPDTFTLTVSNINAEPAIFDADDPGQFSLIVNSSPKLISASFAPGGLGPMEGSLTIFSDDPAFPQYTIALKGEGILERTPPAVDSTWPADGYSEHAVTDSLIVYFTERLLESTITEGALEVWSTRTGLEISGSIVYEWDEDMSVLVFIPTNGFSIADSIVVTVDGNLTDIVGNSLDGDGDGTGSGSPEDDYLYSFTTGLAVYPCDANNDGIVNEMDILPIGVYWGMTGPPRSDAPSFVWTRQAAQSWDDPNATYADCDGNGVVEMADFIAIGSNWGLNHDIEGTPIVFTLEQLEEAQRSFDALNDIIGGTSLGENDQKIRDILASYISVQSNIETFRLGRNFPNPFNPITTIDFSIPYTCHVQVEVYNVLGQRVKPLLDNTLPSGIHTVTWDGTNSDGAEVPSGVYFYRMIAEGFNEVKKMLLIR